MKARNRYRLGIYGCDISKIALFIQLQNLQLQKKCVWGEIDELLWL